MRPNQFFIIMIIVITTDNDDDKDIFYYHSGGIRSQKYYANHFILGSELQALVKGTSHSLHRLH